MRGSKEVVKLWLDKADDDELNIKSILKHRDGTPGGVCFLSQQMAEKNLKGLLVYVNNDLVKIHDLVKIASLISEFIPDVNGLLNDYKLLNRFYIDTRYPGDFPEFSWNDAEEACEAAKRIKEFVLGKINKLN